MTNNAEINLILDIIKTNSFCYGNPKLAIKGRITTGDQKLSFSVHAANYEKADLLYRLINAIDGNTLTDEKIDKIRKALM